MTKGVGGLFFIKDITRSKIGLLSFLYFNLSGLYCTEISHLRMRPGVYEMYSHFIQKYIKLGYLVSQPLED